MSYVILFAVLFAVGFVLGWRLPAAVAAYRAVRPSVSGPGRAAMCAAAAALGLKGGQS